MKTDTNKLWVLIILSISFLAYSFILYMNPPVSQGENKEIEEIAKRGKLVWQNKNCVSCHQIYGLGGHLGPDLTNVSARRTPEYIEVFLKYGTNVMPNFHLNQKEVDELQAFLIEINQSGKSDPRTFKQNFDGTIAR